MNPNHSESFSNNESIHCAVRAIEQLIQHDSPRSILLIFLEHLYERLEEQFRFEESVYHINFLRHRDFHLQTHQTLLKQFTIMMNRMSNLSKSEPLNETELIGFLNESIIKHINNQNLRLKPLHH